MRPYLHIDGASDDIVARRIDGSSDDNGIGQTQVFLERRVNPQTYAAKKQAPDPAISLIDNVFKHAAAKLKSCLSN